MMKNMLSTISCIQPLRRCFDMSENELADLRSQIDDVDRQMAELFIRRMMVSGNIAVFKKKAGLNIFDQEREKEKLAAQEMQVPELLRPYYREFLEKCMELSKNYQKEVQIEL
ncbi:MAG: chorismate mutase [Lachnospiraceae bacterium]|nr:chorismate mutase [Lachnospiraceae bacterium]